MKANVFNIERYATEDGHGIRTVVFLKGCSLRCRWCANPESQSWKPEVLLNVNTCIQCGRCEQVCPQSAISYKEGFGYITDASKCTVCGRCVSQCYMDARRVMGTIYETESLLKEICKDEQYFKMSSGGVTFSGGEPFYYDETICEIAGEMRKRGYTTLVETCGQIPKEKLQKASQAVDYIYYDFKHYDPGKHRELTGYDNTLILENLKWLDEHYQGKLSIRYPYIPGCNSAEEDIRGFFEEIGRLSHVEEVIFLPYHRLGLPKYQGLGRVYEMGDRRSLKKAELNHLPEIASEYGIDISIQ